MTVIRFPGSMSRKIVKGSSSSLDIFQGHGFGPWYRRLVPWFVLALVLSFMFGYASRVNATTYVYSSGGSSTGSCPGSLSGDWATAEAAGAAVFAACQAAGTFTSSYWSLGSCTPPGAPTGAGGADCAVNGGGSPAADIGMFSVACGGSGPACPVTCTSGLTMNILDAIGGASSASGGSMCVAGCTYTNSASTLTVSASGGTAGPTVYGLAVSSGATCSGTTSGTHPGNNCFSYGGNTFCADNNTGVAVLNGDSISPGSPAPGHCINYADGSVSCNVTGGATPPVPTVAGSSSGASPATPTGVVQQNGDTSNYYSSSTVSSTTTASGSQGSSSGASQGAGSGSGPSAPNGDCGAPGVACTGAVPAADSSGDTWASITETFYTSIQSAPIVSAASAVSAAWPSDPGCHVSNLTLTTFPGKTFDYGTTACGVWDTYASPALATVAQAMWALLALLIVLSA